MKMTKNLEGISTVQLQLFVDKLERLEEEKSEATKNLSDCFSEVGSAGFDKRVIKAILRLRKMDKDRASEHESLLSLYKSVLGM